MHTPAKEGTAAHSAGQAVRQGVLHAHTGTHRHVQTGMQTSPHIITGGSECKGQRWTGRQVRCPVRTHKHANTRTGRQAGGWAGKQAGRQAGRHQTPLSRG